LAIGNSHCEAIAEHAPFLDRDLEILGYGLEILD